MKIALKDIKGLLPEKEIIKGIPYDTDDDRSQVFNNAIELMRERQISVEICLQCSGKAMVAYRHMSGEWLHKDCDDCQGHGLIIRAVNHE